MPDATSRELCHIMSVCMNTGVLVLSFISALICISWILSQGEIIRAHHMFQTHSTASGAAFSWERLFEPCTREFFSNFPRYIQVSVSECWWFV